MARRHDTTPDTCDETRLRWLRAQLRSVCKDREAAAENCSHSAVAALRREERNLRDLIDTGRMQMAKAKEEANRVELSAEEKAQRARETISSAHELELEVAVAEWLRRKRYTLAVEPGGRLHIVPQGDVRPGLRLVE